MGTVPSPRLLPELPVGDTESLLTWVCIGTTEARGGVGRQMPAVLVLGHGLRGTRGKERSRRQQGSRLSPRAHLALKAVGRGLTGSRGEPPPRPGSSARPRGVQLCLPAGPSPGQSIAPSTCCREITETRTAPSTTEIPYYTYIQSAGRRTLLIPTG